jgi:hypothetical protein
MSQIAHCASGRFVIQLVPLNRKWHDVTRLASDLDELLQRAMCFVDAMHAACVVDDYYGTRTVATLFIHDTVSAGSALPSSIPRACSPGKMPGNTTHRDILGEGLRCREAALAFEEASPTQKHVTGDFWPWQVCNDSQR